MAADDDAELAAATVDERDEDESDMLLVDELDEPFIPLFSPPVNVVDVL